MKSQGVLFEDASELYLKDIILGQQKGKLKISKILGDYYEKISVIYYGKVISLNLNNIITEMIDNITENTLYLDSFFAVKVFFFDSKIVIQTSNRLSPEQMTQVCGYIDNLNNPEWFEIKYHETLESDPESGLGLMRIMRETNSVITYVKMEEDLVISVEMEL